MAKTSASALMLALVLSTAAPAGAADDQACCQTLAPPPATANPAKVLPHRHFTDQQGRTVSLPDGRIWAVAFFYGSCKTVCPRLIYNLTELKAALPADQQERVAFAAITFDPERDSAERLKSLAQSHDFTAANQYLLRGDGDTTATATRVFGFDFKPDGQGDFRHSNLLAVMDGQGRVVRHFYGLEPNLERVAHVIGQLRP